MGLGGTLKSERVMFSPVLRQTEGPTVRSALHGVAEKVKHLQQGSKLQAKLSGKD